MKRVVCWMLAILFACVLTGCGADMCADTNGEGDFTLQTLTDYDILHVRRSVRVMSSTKRFGNKTVCKTKTLSGVTDLYDAFLRGEDFQITVSSEFTKGNARLVLVLDDAIIHDFALNGEDQTFVLPNAKGRIHLRVAGESTGYRVEYRIQ